MLRCRILHLKLLFLQGLEIDRERYFLAIVGFSNSPLLYLHYLPFRDVLILRHDPFEPSKYPGTYLCRICTVGRFAFTSQPDLTFTLLNTHMDHASDPARRLGASLLLWRARYEAVQTKSPVFVTGDLNR